LLPVGEVEGLQQLARRHVWTQWAAEVTSSTLPSRAPTALLHRQTPALLPTSPTGPVPMIRRRQVHSHVPIPCTALSNSCHPFQNQLPPLPPIPAPTGGARPPQWDHDRVAYLAHHRHIPERFCRLLEASGLYGIHKHKDAWSAMDSEQRLRIKNLNDDIGRVVGGGGWG